MFGRVALVPCENPHVPSLFRIVTQPANLIRWRTHGAMISSEEFVRSISASDSETFAVVETASSRPVGLASVYGTNLRHGYAYIGIVIDDELVGGSYGAEAGTLLINYLFENFPFRKLYMEVPEFTAPSVESRMPESFVKEAHYRRHFTAMGALWDLFIYAVYREPWLADNLLSHGKTQGDLTIAIAQDEPRERMETNR